MGCQVDFAAKIVEHKADFLVPLKGDQPTLKGEVEAYFETAPAEELVCKTTVEKGHGRIETRVFTASKVVDWIESEKSYPGPPRFKDIHTTFHVLNRTEYTARRTFDTRIYISSAPLNIQRLAAGSRGHWGVENMHWVLDVEFKDDLSRYRAGHGAKNMAVVRRFSRRPPARQQIQRQHQNPALISELENPVPPRNTADEMIVNLGSVPCSIGGLARVDRALQSRIGFRRRVGVSFSHDAAQSEIQAFSTSSFFRWNRRRHYRSR